ncbi:SAM-dependent methyltransferase [Williamsia sp. SKLECPSW1]
MTAAAPSNAAFWEDLYARRPLPSATAPPRPNAALVHLHETLGLRPVRALDLGAGPGGDAIWLAAQGWRVTAVDVSATAVARLRDLAGALDLADRVHPVRHDLARSLPTTTFDLVYACYLHTPVDIGRDGILRRAADLLGVGGVMIVVDHASTAPWSWAEADTRYPTPQQTFDDIGLGDDWEPLLLTARDRVATGPGGETATVTDNLVVARRRRERPFSARAERENHRRQHPEPHTDPTVV